MVLEILKVAFLFLGIMFTTINIVRTSLKNSVSPMNIIYQTTGITGFIYLQWLM